MEGFQISRVHLARGSLEQGALSGGLGERNHVPQRLGLGQEHHDPVQPEGKPAVGWRPRPESLQQLAEPLLRLLLLDPQQGEDPVL